MEHKTSVEYNPGITAITGITLKDKELHIAKAGGKYSCHWEFRGSK
jgi:hypothetical protein